MAALNRKLNGASLLETVVALTIMLMVILLSLRFVLQVTLSSDRAAIIRAECLLEKTAVESISKRAFVNQTITDDPEIRVERMLQNYGEDPAVKILKLEAYDKANTKLTEIRMLVRDE